MKAWALIIDAKVVRVYATQERAREDEEILNRIQSSSNYWEIQETEVHTPEPSEIVNRGR